MIPELDIRPMEGFRIQKQLQSQQGRHRWIVVLGDTTTNPEQFKGFLGDWFVENDAEINAMYVRKSAENLMRAKRDPEFAKLPSDLKIAHTKAA